MATERQSPDAIIASSGLDVSGGISHVQDDPDSADANWFTSTGSNGSLRVSFPTPTGDPTTGAGTQEFRVLLRKDASGGGDPTYTAELRETGGGSALQTLATDVAITTADPGEVESLTWDAANLATADGSAVELLLTLSKGGGGPNERNIEVGAVEWNVDYSADTSDDLLAEDIEAASEVSSPSIGQVHVLGASDIEALSELSGPALGQVHALTATSVEATAEVSAPALAEVTALGAEDVESASEVSTPALGQIHALIATAVESGSEMTAPSLGQIHALLAEDIECLSVLSSPKLGGTVITKYPVVYSPLVWPTRRDRSSSFRALM